MTLTRPIWLALVPTVCALCFGARAETIPIVLPAKAPLRVQFGAEDLTQALREVGADVEIDRVGRNPGRKIYLNQPFIPSLSREIFLLTKRPYRFSNSLQTGHRKIPFPGAATGMGTNYHWTQVLPLYEKELADFRAQVAELRKPKPEGASSDAAIAAWPAAAIKLISTNAETYKVELDARPFADRKHMLTGLAPAAPLSPHAAVQPIPLGEARWTTGFWADRFELCRTQMLPSMGRLMEGTNYSQFFRNFEIAAGLAEGRSRGAPFNDGEFYKLIEAASAVQAVAPSDYFDRSLDRGIAVIAQAQRADGYLHTPVLIRQRNGDTNAAPFQDRNNFELYNLGHLMSAACVHHQATGKTNLLAVACKAANFLAQALSNGPPDVLRSSVCPSHYMGLVALYRETGEARYLKLTRELFAQRSKIKDGGDDNQDRVPFEQQTNAIGHAVRANYLYAGATDLFIETGDASFWKPLLPIWTNLVSQKMHVTGGCGALYDGASPFGAKDQKNITRTHQSYGHNYELPNTTAHNETCAAIGNVLWNWRMFLATGEARFMDVIELALYNGVLSGVALDGTNFFYTNPLRVTDPLPTDLRWPRARVPFAGSFCCPPNIARTLASVGNYAFARSPGALWVNLYGGSSVATLLDGVGKVSLTQETEYPWSGQVRLKVMATDGGEFALRLRIPGWATRATVRVNHRPQDLDAKPGQYASLRRAWKAGDVIDLDLPMQTRLMEAHPLVEETFNQVAVQRGPLVYCLESVDLPKGTRILEVAISPDIQLAARYDARLLGGVVILEGAAEARRSGDWQGRLYREFEPRPSAPMNIRLVPYYAWGNRGAGEMTVWMPRAR